MDLRRSSAPPGNPGVSMQRASAAFQRGDFATAVREARAASLAVPTNAAIRQFLGVAYCAKGDVAAGLVEFRKALRLSPHDPTLAFNAAKAALDLGDYAQARTFCQPIAGTVEGKRLLAEIAMHQPGAGDGLAHYAQLAAENPTDFEILNNYANALVEQGDRIRAIKLLRKAHALAPQSPQVLLNLGRAHTAQGDFGVATEAFLAAAQLPTENGDLRFEIGQSLLRHGQHQAALVQLAEAARLGIKTAAVFVAIGVCFFALERRAEAENAFRTALGLDRASSRAALNLAMLYERENRVEDLRKVAEAARQHVAAGADLDFIDALVLRREDRFEEAYAKARASAADSLDPTLRAQFIGQLADRLGRHGEAYEAYDEMNRAAMFGPDAVIYATDAYPRQIEAATRLVTPQWRATWTDVGIADDYPSPIFLGGFLRSGTTLLDTILMGHPDTLVREEEPMLAALEAAADRDIAGLARADAAQVARMRQAYYAEFTARGPLTPGKLPIDKYPLMTLRATYIQRAFPDAKYIFALRHPCDVVWSCWTQNFRVTEAMSAFLTLESSARMYAAAMEHWMACREALSPQVHTVRYEDMVTDLESSLRPLLTFLGLEWDDGLLRFQETAAARGYIRTPSYAQVTERIYDRSRERWRNYRAQLEPVLDILAPWAACFGYRDPRD